MTRRSGRFRVVFDCNTFVQAVAFDNGPAAQCVKLVESGHVELFLSKSVLAELRRVFGYDEVLAISHNMTPPRIAAFLKRLTYRATLVRNMRHAIDFERDRKDEPYLDLAAATRADYLVTRDKDLLSLMTGHTAFCKRFRQTTHPLRIVNPVEFIQAVEG